MAISLEKIKFKQEEIDKKLSGSDRLRSLRDFVMHMEYMQYMEPGQVVVCRCMKDGHKRLVGELMKNGAGAIQKWIVADKVYDGLVVARKLGIDGRPGKTVTLLADIVDPSEWRFEEDPDIADSILLDFDYDPLKGPKLMGKARKKMKKYNNDIHFSSVYKNWKKISGNTGCNELDFLRYHRDTNVGLLWTLEDDVRKIIMNITDINDSQVLFTDNTAEKGYSLASRWGKQYYMSEPLTREEALQLVKSK